MIGCAAALLVNILSVLIDFVSFRNGWTKIWPKKIDVALCLLWIVFLISLITIPNDKFIRLYMGVIINATLAFMSLISASIGKPWIADNAADTVSDDEFIRKLENPTRQSERKRIGFMYICKVLTFFWSGLFCLLTFVILINVELNTKYSENKTLTHPNQLVFILAGIVVPFSVVFFGIWASPRISKILESRLRAQSNGEELPKEGEGDSKDDDTPPINQTSISEPLLQ